MIVNCRVTMDWECDCVWGDKDGEGKECIHNFGWGTSWKTLIWKTDK
jgi:hypothetical protein